MVTTSAPRTLVGRLSEMAALDGLLARAAAGEPSLVVLTGEVGIGKSRLLGAFCDQAAARPLTGACFPVAGEATPYAPVTQAFRALGRTLGRTRGEDERGRVAWCWPDELAPLRPRSSVLAASGSASSQGRLFEQVLTTLGELGYAAPGRPPPAPVVLALEDVHWADRSTLDLLSFLVRNLSDERVLVVVTLRSDDADSDTFRGPWYAELVRLPQVTTLQLDRLDHDETAQHLGGLLHRPASDAETDRVFAQTRGNPLFTEQALDWLLQPDRSTPLPDSLRSLVAARLALLPDRTRRVLDVAAVLGRAATVGLLGSVLEQEPARVEDSLWPAVAHHLVAPEGATYAFVHPLFSEVIGGQLLPERRRLLHAAAARSLVALGEGPEESHGHDVAGRVAFHWQAAGSTVLAFRASIAAGMSALRLHAFSEADEQLGRAVALLADLDGEDSFGPSSPSSPDAPADAVDLLARAAQAAHLVGDGVRAADLADRAVAGTDDPARQAAIWERKGQYCFSAGMAVEAEAAYDEVLALLPDTSRDPVRLRAMTGRAALLVAWSRFVEGEESCRDALARARAIGDVAETGRALMALGYLRAQAGRLEDGAVALRASLAAAREAGDPDEVARVLINLTHVLGMQGRHDEVVAVAAEGYEELRRAGLARQDGAFVQANAVESMIKSGRWREAHDLLSVAEAHRPRGLRAFPVLCESARLALLTGDLERARQGAERLEAFRAEHGLPDAWLRELWEITSAVAWWSGDPDGALAIAREALAVIGRSGEQSFAARLGWVAVRALGDLAERDGPARWGGVLAEVGRELRAMTPDPTDAAAARLPDAAAWAHTLAAELTRAHRRADPRAWERAVRAWSEVGERYPLLYARWRRAEALVMRRAGGEATVTAVRTAYDDAVALGAARVAAEVEKVATWARVDLAPAARPVPAADAGADRRGADYGLTAREREVLGGLVAGRTNSELAGALHISVKTASVHVSNILRKLQVTHREEAARIGARLDLEPRETADHPTRG